MLKIVSNIILLRIGCFKLGDEYKKFRFYKWKNRIKKRRSIKLWINKKRNEIIDVRRMVISTKWSAFISS